MKIRNWKLKIGRGLLIFFLIFSWVFSGWPQIFNFPPEIQEARAQAPIPAYRASGTFTAGTTSITPPYPTGMAANDVCLLAVTSENEAISLTTANGFVELPTVSPQSAGTAATDPASRLAVFWKRTVGGDSAPVVADSGNNTEGVIHCFSGVITTGNPWDTNAGGNDGAANDTTGNVPGSTTTVDNTLIVLINSTSNNGTSTAQFSGWTNADLANILEMQDNSHTAGLGGGSGMATGEKATAGAYTTTTVTLAVTSFKGAISIALKPELPTYNQSAYRLFNNLDSTDVGTALAAQDTAATLGSTGAVFRLRMLLHIGANQLIASGQSFKLQFAAQSGTCDTSFVGETYADVTAATVIAYKDNATPADGATLTANANAPTHGADTIVNQTYEELNNFTNSVAAISSGQDGQWDFALIDNGATAATAYCLRAVKSDGTVLNTYTVIPQITTAAASASLTLTIDGGGVVAFGTLTNGTRKTGTTRLKVTQTGATTLTISAGRQLAVSNVTLASNASPFVASNQISDTAGGINAFDGLGANCTDGTGPAAWGTGVSTGLGFVLWTDSNSSKETACWGTGTTEIDALNKYAALQASISASSFINISSAPPATLYTSIGYSLDVSSTQKATPYNGGVVFTATVTP